jgi:hypothetical protein
MIPKNIKLLIENRFGRKILYSKDCEALAINIKRACGESVSATTLKRLLGFAKNVERPRLYTLDILATYLDFSDWSSLLSSTPNYETRLTALSADNTHSIQQQLIIMMMTGVIDINTVKALCIKHGSCDEIINFIIDLIMLAGRSKNVLFLKQVFDLPVVYDSIISNPRLLDTRLYFIGQTVGMALRSDSKMAAELIRTYGTNPVAQVILIEWFVDEDYINAYYGDLLEVYFKHKPITDETKIFYYALKHTQAFQNKNNAKQTFWAKKVRKIPLSDTMHPILIGRYLGICLAEDADSVFENAVDVQSFILNCFKKYNFIQKGYLTLFTLRYLFAKKSEDWIIKLSDLFIAETAKDKINEKTFWEIKIDNQLFIYFAFAQLLKGNKKLAHRLINNTDLHLFDVFRYRGLHNDFSEVQKILKRA